MVDQDVSAEENASEEGGGGNLSGMRRRGGEFGISSASFYRRYIQVSHQSIQVLSSILYTILGVGGDTSTLLVGFFIVGAC